MSESVDLEKLTSLVEDLSASVADTPDNSNATEFEKLLATDPATVTDAFMRYRVKVAQILTEYNNAREEANVTDTGLSESITNLATPFLKGNFTLAVVGKMSAGKSTFVNALLGDSTLLPTGHFQTTCTLTSISHSPERRVRVIYGDNHEDTIEGECIGERLAQLVAIDPEYKHLPVNNVNRLILAGKSTSEICSDKCVAEMAELSKTDIDMDILHRYLDTHDLSNIPMAVSIECPINEQYRGWRIVDTPGVDAVGGIEDDTKAFLCGTDEMGYHNVDAIIFIQAAKGNIEERALNEFVAQTMDSISEEARKRTFFVLTHASDQDFMLVKDEVIERANKFFVQTGNIGIADERLVAVDSLLALMLDDETLDFKNLVKKNAGVPDGWNESDWKICRNLILQMKNIIEYDDEAEFNNENVRNKMSQIANFDGLRNMLDSFVQNEKQLAFSNFVNHVLDDINNFIELKRDDVRILMANLGRTPEQFAEDLKSEKHKLDTLQLRANKVVATIAENFKKSKVNSLFEKRLAGEMTLESFMALPTLNKMRQKAETLGNNVEKVKDAIIADIKEQIGEFLVDEKKRLNVQLDTIDIDTIELEARRESTSTYTVKVRGKKKSGVAGSVGRFFGRIFSNDWGYEEEEEEHVETDTKKQHEYEAKKVFSSLKQNFENYVKNVIAQLDLISIALDTSIKQTISRRKADYDALNNKSGIVDTIKKKEKEISILETHVEDIKNKVSAA